MAKRIAFATLLALGAAWFLAAAITLSGCATHQSSLEVDTPLEHIERRHYELADGSTKDNTKVRSDVPLGYGAYGGAGPVFVGGDFGLPVPRCVGLACMNAAEQAELTNRVGGRQVVVIERDTSRLEADRRALTDCLGLAAATNKVDKDCQEILAATQAAKANK